MSRRTKVIAAVALLVVVGGVVVALAVGGARAVEIETATAVDQNLAVTVTASGRVESGTRADIFPPTGGVLESVLVADGDRVSAGMVVARLETAPLEAQVAAARAALAAAESQLKAVDDQEPRSADLAAARAGTSAAWQAYQAALLAFDQVGAQAPAQADVDAAAAAKTAAFSAYSSAKTNYTTLKASVDASAFPVPASLAALDSAKIAMDQAYAGYTQAVAAQSKIIAYDGSALREQSRSARDQAYAAYLSARAQQSKLEGTSLSSQRTAAQAGVDQARKGLALAEETLDDADLVAPIDGVILFNALGSPAADGKVARAAEGAAVAPQAAPFTVVDLGGLVFSAEVDEVDVDKLKAGMSGVIALDALPSEEIETTLATVRPAATQTPTGGTVFAVEFPVEGVDANVLIGMRGDVTIEVDAVPDAVVVPVEALFDEGGTTYVYAVDGEVLSRTEVTVGTVTETSVQILSGVSADDVVALSGQIELVDGMRVKAIK